MTTFTIFKPVSRNVCRIKEEGQAGKSRGSSLLRKQSDVTVVTSFSAVEENIGDVIVP